MHDGPDAHAPFCCCKPAPCFFCWKPKVSWWRVFRSPAIFSRGPTCFVGVGVGGVGTVGGVVGEGVGEGGVMGGCGGCGTPCIVIITTLIRAANTR